MLRPLPEGLRAREGLDNICFIRRPPGRPNRTVTTPYKIDYSTQKENLDSKLCTMPNELLLGIGKIMFAGFALEFSIEHESFDFSAAVLCPVRDFDLRNLKILRLCKAMRGKLLPLLHSMMGSYVCSFHQQISTRRPIVEVRNYPWGMTKTIDIPLSIRSRIRTLELSTNARFVPDPSAFDNLSQIKINIYHVQNAGDPIENASPDDLLVICRSLLREDLIPAERATVARYYLISNPSPQWLPLVLRNWKQDVKLRSVNIILKYNFRQQRVIGASPDTRRQIVEHDIGASQATLYIVGGPYAGDPYRRPIPVQWRRN